MIEYNRRQVEEMKKQYDIGSDEVMDAKLTQGILMTVAGIIGFIILICILVVLK